MEPQPIETVTSINVDAHTPFKLNFKHCFFTLVEAETRSSPPPLSKGNENFPKLGKQSDLLGSRYAFFLTLIKVRIGRFMIDQLAVTQGIAIYPLHQAFLLVNYVSDGLSNLKINSGQWEVQSHPMMTSSNRNIFRVIGHLCGEFTGHRWIPHTKASDAELWCFFICARINGWLNNGKADSLRCNHVHYDVTVMSAEDKNLGNFVGQN